MVVFSMFSITADPPDPGLSEGSVSRLCWFLTLNEARAAAAPPAQAARSRAGGGAGEPAGIGGVAGQPAGVAGGAVIPPGRPALAKRGLGGAAPRPAASRATGSPCRMACPLARRA